MACRKMDEDVAYARNTESGCNKREKKNSTKIVPSKERNTTMAKRNIQPTTCRTKTRHLGHVTHNNPPRPAPNPDEKGGGLGVMLATSLRKETLAAETKT